MVLGLVTLVLNHVTEIQVLSILSLCSPQLVGLCLQSCPLVVTRWLLQISPSPSHRGRARRWPVPAFLSCVLVKSAKLPQKSLSLQTSLPEMLDTPIPKWPPLRFTPQGGGEGLEHEPSGWLTVRGSFRKKGCNGNDCG